MEASESEDMGMFIVEDGLLQGLFNIKVGSVNRQHVKVSGELLVAVG